MAGLYIHIPFCLQKCRYCDFVSYTDMSLAERYCHALIREMAQYGETMRDKVIETVFIGGGTPSALEGEAIAAVLGEVGKRFSLCADVEVTIECNPCTVTPDKLRRYADAGVNRISLGCQSTHDDILSSIGRLHNAAGFERALENVLRAGFENINVDVMYGLPGQTVVRFAETVEHIASLPIAHISAYSLILEPGTPLYESVQSGATTLPDDEVTADMQDDCIQRLEARGFTRYEVSNFSRAGCECRHNLNYWRNGEYLGVGAAAHSALRLSGWTRFSNTPDLGDYIAAVTASGRAVVDERAITSREERFEGLMLGLRMACGVALDEFAARYGVTAREAACGAIEALEGRALLVEEGGSIRATARGMDLLNVIDEELYAMMKPSA
ncbi:MAG: radical SAM family heme chaperone HemW [Clostridia bacterium]|nr:radical SAM family heme chaperone HemW [Clostridia bacterium]